MTNKKVDKDSPLELLQGRELWMFAETREKRVAAVSLSSKIISSS
jgi:hypothetical protein